VTSIGLCRLPPHIHTAANAGARYVCSMFGCFEKQYFKIYFVF